eukprot:2047941-Alexandrium_andersonii.AAC.1
MDPSFRRNARRFPYDARQAATMPENENHNHRRRVRFENAFSILVTLTPHTIPNTTCSHTHNASTVWAKTFLDHLVACLFFLLPHRSTLT